MKANNAELRHAFVMGLEAAQKGLQSIAQDSEFLAMLAHFATSFNDLADSYQNGKNAYVK